MGLLSAISKAYKGESGIKSVDEIVGIDADGITPENPGKWGIYRTIPVLKEPRTFTKQEADALTAVASASKIETDATKQAIEAMKTIKTSDTSKQKAFNSYRQHEAIKTTEQVENNSQTAQAIEGMRSRYAIAHQGLQAAINSENAKQKAIFGNTEKAQEFAKFW